MGTVGSTQIKLSEDAKEDLEGLCKILQWTKSRVVGWPSRSSRRIPGSPRSRTR